MADEGLRIVEPAVEYEAEFREFVDELFAEGRGHVAALPGQKRPGDFAAYVAKLRAQSRGEDLPEGYVPGTAYWLVDSDGRVLGIASLRHRLTEHLLHEGGHIGYSVRPTERNKGYGTRMCAMVLEKCREMGIMRVLITCDKDNVASARVIQKNGGVLENETISTETGKMKQRYWIDL